MKHILALPSWGLICIPMEQEAFTFPNMEVGHPAHDIARTLSRIHVHLRSFGGHGTIILVKDPHFGYPTRIELCRIQRQL